jgi:hypothetical protein
MKRLAALHAGLVGLALTVFSGHALAATSCNTGPAGPLNPANPAFSGTVTGGVVVHEGAFCVIEGANISGGLRVKEGAVVVVCASTINGGFTTEEASEILVGAEEIGCGGNRINGAVRISETGPGILPSPAPSIALENSAINGSVHLSENAGPIAVASNTIAGGLFCSENKFALEDEGSPSIVTGKTTCKFAE